MRLIKTFLILFAVLTVEFSKAQCPPSFKCPKEGRSKKCQKITDPEKLALNLGKNRSAKIPPGMADYWDIEQIIDMADIEDRHMLQNGEYRWTEGYIIDVIEEGPESCNCYQATKENKDGDVHIYLGVEPDARKADCVIVEITPDFKKRNPDYMDLLVENSKVRVFGYLLYDIEHRRNAAMTCSSCTQVWRKTNWELHPLVAVEKL